jgi:hypothetical protein
MDMSPSAQSTLVEPGQRAHVEALLRNYPRISAAETSDILCFLKKGPPLEVALMTADDTLKDRLDAFRSDHAAEFSLGMKEYVAVAALIVAVLTVCVLLADIGVN